MVLRTVLRSLVALPLLAGALACGGGGCGCGEAPTSTVGLALSGGAAEGLQAFTVAVTKVEALGAAGWVEGSRKRSSVDLVALAPPASQFLDSLALPPATYTALRLTFESPASARLADGSTVSVAVPVALAAAPITFSAGDIASVDLALILDPGRCLQARGGGYALMPALLAVDRRRSGSIAGRLTESNGQPLPGAVVSVQWFEGLGDPRIARRALTRADGTYTLDLLPFGVAQHLVSWSTAGARAFEPRATAAFTPSSAQAAFAADLVVPARPDSAAVSGTISPAASATQSDEVELTYGPVQAGSLATLFIVGAKPASVQASESYAFGPIPQGSTYQLRARRRTWAADGSSSVSTQFSTDLGFLTGITHVVDFQF